MRRAWWLGLLIGLVAVPQPQARAKPTAPAGGARLDAVTLLIKHRVFHDFRDLQRVKLKQDFLLGDTDYSARVVEYLPDFTMDLASRKIVSKSDRPDNPAFRIVVFKQKLPQDTTWALLNMPPHFARKSLFAFQVVKIEFTDRAPIMVDTTRAAPAAPAKMPSGHPAAPATPDSAPGR
jgi:hypothetical protein